MSKTKVFAEEMFNYAKFPEIEKIKLLEAELALLRKVAEAAREFFEGTGCEPKECKKCDPKYINFCERSGIGQSLAELDKEGNKKD